MEILAQHTPTAVFMGFVDKGWEGAKAIGSWLGQKFIDGGKFLGGLAGQIGSAIQTANKVGWGNFLKGWFQDDPIGAGAGVGAAVLSAGVLIFGGGGALLGTLGRGLVGLLRGSRAALGNFGSAFVIWKGFQWLFRQAVVIYNFNWNISDKDIRAQQEALMNNAIIQAGGTLGRALGGLLCGATAGLATVRIDVALMADLWEVINEETKEEILSAFSSLIAYTKQMARQIAFLETYRNARKWIKNNVKTGIKAIDEKLANWGKEGSKPWSFAIAVEEQIEKIDNKTLQAFTENAVEEFMDSCTEALLQTS